MAINRILCIVDSMDTGGAETFLMKLFRKFDKEETLLDFIVTSNSNGFYEKEILNLGGRIFRCPPKTRRPIASFFSIMQIVRKYQYKIVLRVSRNSISAIDLLAARFGGAKTLALRSNNTQNNGNLIARMTHRLFIPISNLICNVRLAPSQDSAEYMFGRNKKVSILKNGVDLSYFRFDQLTRERIRNELHVTDEVLLGHVGRFDKQKNHVFLLEVFHQISKSNPKTRLLLIGKGDLYQEIISRASTLNLLDRIIHIKETDIVRDYLMSMDIFLFPSLYEGLPNTVIEAQCSGLQCLISDSITNEVYISDTIKSLPINSIDVWTDEVNKAINLKKYTERNLYEIDETYDINRVIVEFKRILSL